MPSLPLVHLNGTSRNQLVAQYSDAAYACAQAYSVLQNAAPHERDYYPRGETAYATARKEHENRLQILETLRMELEYIALEIQGN